MNAKNIFEVLAALGAGAMVAGCNTAPDPAGGSKVTPVAEVFAASPSPKAAPVITAPTNKAESAAVPAVVVPPVEPVPAHVVPPVVTTPVAPAATKYRAITTAVATEKPAPITPPVAIATAVATAPTKAGAIPAPTTKKKTGSGAEKGCGEGACG